MTVRRLDAKDCWQSCGLTSKGLSLCLFELNYTGYTASRLEMEALFMIYTQSIFLAYILSEIVKHGEASLNYQHLIVFAVIACIELVIKKFNKTTN